MYTSTPLSPHSFSLLHHFLPLSFSLLLSSSFPSSFLLSSSPLFPPCFPVIFISIFCLFPLLHSPPLLLAVLLSLLPFAQYHSPPSLLLLPLFPFSPLSFYHPLLSFPLLPCHFLLPSSASFPSFSPSSSSSVASLSFSPPSPLLLIILPLLYFYSPLILQLYQLPVHLSPSFAPFSTLFQPLYSFFPLSHFSLHLSSPFSYLLFSLPSLLICRIHCLFLPLPSFLLPPLSFDTSPTCKIDLFHFLPVKAQTIPTNPLFTSTTFCQKLFSLPTISTISPTHFSHTNNQNSNKQSTFPTIP